MKHVFMAIALLSTPLLADEVHLKGGGRLTGEIVDQTAENITVDIGAGRMTVKMTTVVRIEKTASPLSEYRARAATLTDQDVEGWRELARWASNQGLGTQAREAYEHVTAVVPDDAEANRGLGLVQQDGRWMTEEESYLARGFVKFEGDWMNPGEKQAILAERQTAAAADAQAIAALVQADQAAAQEREAQEAAERTTSGTTPCRSSAIRSTGGATATRRRSGPCNRYSRPARPARGRR